VSAACRERSLAAAHPRRTEGTCRSNTRISSFAGRVTEAAVPRKGEPSGRTCRARPPVTRTTCSDVLRVRRGDNRCPGDNKPGLTAVHALAQASVELILDSFAPEPARRHVLARATNLALLAASHPGHRSTLGCTSDDDEGATRRAAPHRATRFVRKQVGASAELPRARTQRVRECDLIRVLCCIAPAVPSDRHRLPAERRRAIGEAIPRERETRESPRRKGRRHPGPG
jgi:hypothetical protein